MTVAIRSVARGWYWLLHLPASLPFQPNEGTLTMTVTIDPATTDRNADIPLSANDYLLDRH